MLSNRDSASAVFACPAACVYAKFISDRGIAMSTLTKLALGMMGQLRPRPAKGDSATAISLPPPRKQGGLPLMEALAGRRSSREFARDALPLALLRIYSGRPAHERSDGGRTAPSAMNAQEIDVFVALPSGAYRYDAAAHELNLVAASDLRRITGYQDFVDEAPLDLVYVADHARMSLVPVAQRESYASAAAGAIAQKYTCLLPAIAWPQSSGPG